MKKICKLLLAALIVVLVPFSAIKIAHASSLQHNGTSNIEDADENVIGTIHTYNYVRLANETYLIVNVEGLQSSNEYKGGSMHQVGLNGYYTGILRFALNNYSSAATVLVVGDGVGSWYEDPNAPSMLEFNLVGCSGFTVYTFSTSSSNTAYTSITGGTANGAGLELSWTDEMSADYQIPAEMIPAYCFTTGSFTNTPLVYSDGDVYPHISIENVPQNGRIVNLPAYTNVNNDVHYVFMTSSNLNSGDITLSSTTNTTLTINEIVPYTFTGMRMYDLVIRYSGRNAANRRIVWNTAIDVYPLFYGYEKNMTENMKALCGLTTDQQQANVILDVIQYDVARIYALLNQQQSQDDQQVIEDTGEVIDDYIEAESGLVDDFSDAFDNIDLHDYTIPESLAATTQWLIGRMEDIVYEVPDMRILFTLPLVLGLALFFIGRGYVVFRQGNIDRARDEARKYADQERMNAAEARYQANKNFDNIPASERQKWGLTRPSNVSGNMSTYYENLFHERWDDD